MKISWPVFFSMWAWIFFACVVGGGGAGIGVFFLAAILFRTVGRNDVWGRLTFFWFFAASAFFVFRLFGR